MTELEKSYEDGVAKAECDIADGCLTFRYGARGEWGEDLRRMLKSRFNVELVVSSCFANAESLATDQGYNDKIKTYIDRIYGSGALEIVLVEVQERRRQRSGDAETIT